MQSCSVSRIVVGYHVKTWSVSMIVVQNHVNTIMVGVKDSFRVSRKNMVGINDRGREPLCTWSVQRSAVGNYVRTCSMPRLIY